MRTAAETIAVLDRMVPLYEQPDGSNNAPPITDWWGLDAAWCNMTESYGWAHGGWSKDGGLTLDMPGVVQQKTGKGWARVDLMVSAFKAAGRWGSTPTVGAAFVIGSGDGAHTGIVVRVNAETLDTIEGNYQNRLARVTRRRDSIRGYCYPAYEAAAPSGLKGFAFVAVHSQLAMDVAGHPLSAPNGMKIAQAPLDAFRDQLYGMFEQSLGVYCLKNLTSGRVLDVHAGAIAENGAPVQLWDYTPGALNQQFKPIPVGPGVVKFQCVASRKVLDVAGGSLAIDAPIVQWEDNGGQNQMWTSVIVSAQ